MIDRLIIICFLVSLLVTSWIHPKILLIALRKDIVDNPGARKLQRTPIPVLGGVTIFFGITLGIACAMLKMDCSALMPSLTAMILIMAVGTMDDIIELSPSFRFLIETVITLLMIFSSGATLDNFHGLWGFYQIPAWFSLPLTVVAVVGIVNAINLIDGVDGLSSGFCIMASVLFGILFYKSGYSEMLLLASISTGALIPFFFHNVFGRRSKMFIGDGGSLLMGIVMSTFVIQTITTKAPCASLHPRLGLVAFTVAVMSIPIFDTLRVMSIRILRGKSPFSPDKTHLHHLFIEMGFSHLGTSFSILSLNFLVVLCWWIAYRLGASIETQFYIVIGISVSVTFVFYKFMKINQSRKTKLWLRMQRLGSISHVENAAPFRWMQQVMDYTAKRVVRFDN